MWQRKCEAEQAPAGSAAQHYKLLLKAVEYLSSLHQNFVKWIKPLNTYSFPWYWFHIQYEAKATSFVFCYTENANRETEHRIVMPALHLVSLILVTRMVKLKTNHVYSELSGIHIPAHSNHFWYYEFITWNDNCHPTEAKAATTNLLNILFTLVVFQSCISKFVFLVKSLDYLRYHNFTLESRIKRWTAHSITCFKNNACICGKYNKTCV